MTPSKINWQQVDTVLLDMDGTLLDLAYDNWFWRSAVPNAYAAYHDMSVDQALAQLKPHFESLAHTLPWYCTDHWAKLTGLPIAQMKQESRERIKVLDGTPAFLQALVATGRQVWLATNAHRDSYMVKLEQTGLGQYFSRIITSHDFGAPKEDQAFWQGVMAKHPFDKQRALFADDSLPVLRAAQTYGIGQVLAMNAPDTTETSPRDMPGFVLRVGRLSELLPIPMR